MIYSNLMKACNEMTNDEVILSALADWIGRESKRTCVIVHCLVGAIVE